MLERGGHEIRVLSIAWWDEVPCGGEADGQMCAQCARLRVYCRLRLGGFVDEKCVLALQARRRVGRRGHTRLGRLLGDAQEGGEDSAASVRCGRHCLSTKDECLRNRWLPRAVGIVRDGASIGWEG